MSTPLPSTQTLKMKPEMWHQIFGSSAIHFKQHIEGKELRVLKQLSSQYPDMVFRVVDETGEEWTVFKSWCMPSVLV